MPETSQNSNNNEPNFVAFKVCDQEYCVDIMAVMEIRGWTKATALPQAPPYLLGVINLRGSVVPILDFPLRLGLKSKGSKRAVTVIVQTGERHYGLLVDEVSEILAIDPAEIKPAPDLVNDDAPKFVSGVIARDDRLIRVIDLLGVAPVVVTTPLAEIA